MAGFKEKLQNVKEKIEEQKSQDRARKKKLIEKRKQDQADKDIVSRGSDIGMRIGAKEMLVDLAKAANIGYFQRRVGSVSERFEYRDYEVDKYDGLPVGQSWTSSVLIIGDYLMYEERVYGNVLHKKYNTIVFVGYIDDNFVVQKNTDVAPSRRTSNEKKLQDGLLKMHFASSNAFSTTVTGEENEYEIKNIRESVEDALINVMFPDHAS